MSRVGRKEIVVPKGVSVTLTGSTMAAKGPLGLLSQPKPPKVEFKQEGDKVTVNRLDDSNEARALHGLARALLQNMVTGVSTGFTRKLEINGVGYRAEVAGDTVKFSLGYSHPIEFKLPKGIKAKVEKNLIFVTGSDRQVLGETVAQMRGFRPPEPYKGKGVKYVEEHIQRKVGKAGATGAG